MQSSSKLPGNLTILEPHGHPVMFEELLWTVESEAIITRITLIVAETPKGPIHLQHTRAVTTDDRRSRHPTCMCPKLSCKELSSTRNSWKCINASFKRGRIYGPRTVNMESWLGKGHLFHSHLKVNSSKVQRLSGLSLRYSKVFDHQFPRASFRRETA